MSFSGTVKEELGRLQQSARHCQLAELASLIYNCGRIEQTKTGKRLQLQTENDDLVKKFVILLQELFEINIDGILHAEDGNHKVVIEEPDQVSQILEAVRFTETTGRCSEMHFSELLIRNSCCKRAFLRGSYLSIGSMSDPEKSYHLEFVCDNEQQADLIRDTIASFDIVAKVVIRKKYYVVYIKEGEAIVDLMNVIEAHVALMEFENLRIVKEMRNSINRKVNCEAANITKTVNAATNQLEDILYIKQHMGLDKLQPTLFEIASLRLENPDLSLKDLGALADPPVGKSGVNHRLKKIGEIADGLRKKYNE